MERARRSMNLFSACPHVVPKSIISSGVKNDPLRSNTRPFSGMHVCFTSVKDKPALLAKAQDLGAICVDFVDRDTTHLVAGALGSAKYQRALKLSIPVLTSQWILDTYSQWLAGVNIHPNQNVDKYLFPPLSGMATCAVQLNTNEDRHRTTNRPPTHRHQHNTGIFNPPESGWLPSAKKERKDGLTRGPTRDNPFSSRSGASRLYPVKPSTGSSELNSLPQPRHQDEARAVESAKVIFPVTVRPETIRLSSPADLRQDELINSNKPGGPSVPSKRSRERDSPSRIHLSSNNDGPELSDIKPRKRTCLEQPQPQGQDSIPNSDELKPNADGLLIQLIDPWRLGC